MVRCCSGIAVLLLAVASLKGGAQSSPEIRLQETPARGVWLDASTGMMWAGKDNGKDVNWKNAVKYCHDLRLARYADWRLASLDELEGIYDKEANAPGLMGPRQRLRFDMACEGKLVLDRQSMEQYTEEG